MELDGLFNNIALTLENPIGIQLQKGEYRLGIIDLSSITEIQPLNQKFEALVSQCKQCGKNTAFLSLQSLDNYLDVEKRSCIQCRHCQTLVQLPKVQKIRDTQGKEFNFYIQYLIPNS